MKKLILIFVLMLVTISLGAFLDALHSNIYDFRYEQCKAQLIAENNYQTQKQVLDCAENAISMKLLGTLLFREGTVLN